MSFQAIATEQKQDTIIENQASLGTFAKQNDILAAMGLIKPINSFIPTWATLTNMRLNDDGRLELQRTRSDDWYDSSTGGLSSTNPYWHGLHVSIDPGESLLLKDIRSAAEDSLIPNDFRIVDKDSGLVIYEESGFVTGAVNWYTLSTSVTLEAGHEYYIEVYDASDSMRGYDDSPIVLDSCRSGTKVLSSYYDRTGDSFVMYTSTNLYGIWGLRYDIIDSDQTAGSAVSNPFIVPIDGLDWVNAFFEAVPPGTNISVDIVNDDTDVDIFTDIDAGEDISSISNSTNIRVEVSVSRPSTSYDMPYAMIAMNYSVGYIEQNGSSNQLTPYSLFYNYSSATIAAGVERELINIAGAGELRDFAFLPVTDAESIGAIITVDGVELRLYAESGDDAVALTVGGTLGATYSTTAGYGATKGVVRLNGKIEFRESLVISAYNAKGASVTTLIYTAGLVLLE